MSVLSLNCQGLGMDSTVREIRNLVRQHAPTVLCVVETQLHRDRVNNLASTLGFKYSFAVSSSGRSGGLGMFWNEEIKVEILPYS
jgi:exonuclease III